MHSGAADRTRRGRRCPLAIRCDSSIGADSTAAPLSRYAPAPTTPRSEESYWLRPPETRRGADHCRRGRRRRSAAAPASELIDRCPSLPVRPCLHHSESEQSFWVPRSVVFRYFCLRLLVCFVADRPKSITIGMGNLSFGWIPGEELAALWRAAGDLRVTCLVRCLLVHAHAVEIGRSA